MNKHLLATCLIILLISVTGCGLIQGPTPRSVSTPTNTSSGANSTAERVPIIFDDDGSPDGTTALLYLLSHPAVDLKAAGISYGEVHPEIYIQHIGRMLDSVGTTDIPLGYGQDSPIAGNNEFPEWIRQAGNNFWGLPLPNAEKAYPAQTAPELMVSIIDRSPQPVTVFVSGPATNLAQALQLDPNIKDNIAAVYMMGGAVYVPGNLDDLVADNPNKVAEWNIYGDPQAAAIAFESGIDFFLIPLDATNQVLVNKQDINQWRQGGAAADFAADIFDMVLNNQGGKISMIWDLMSAAIMMDHSLCGFQPLHLQVITQDGNTSGQTAVLPDGAANISVCLEPRADAIRQTLVDVFSGSTASPAQGIPTAATIFRDDFTGNIQPGWRWQDEDPSRWAILPDGWLQITGQDASLFADGAQSNLLCRPAPDGDFQITARVSADPTVDFQQAALYFYQDGGNYTALTRGHCSVCETGGSGIFLEHKAAGAVSTYNVGTQDTDVLLRLAIQGQTVTAYYALASEEWQRLGEVGNSLENADVCLGVSNSDPAFTDADLVGRFDYFEISGP